MLESEAKSGSACSRDNKSLASIDSGKTKIRCECVARPTCTSLGFEGPGGRVEKGGGAERTSRE